MKIQFLNRLFLFYFFLHLALTQIGQSAELPLQLKIPSTLLYYQLSSNTQLEVQLFVSGQYVQFYAFILDDRLSHPFNLSHRTFNTNVFLNDELGFPLLETNEPMELPPPDRISGQLPNKVTFDQSSSIQENLKSDGFFIIRNYLPEFFDNEEPLANSNLLILDLLSTLTNLSAKYYNLNEPPRLLNGGYRHYSLATVHPSRVLHSPPADLLISIMEYKESEKPIQQEFGTILLQEDGFYYIINSHFTNLRNLQKSKEGSFKNLTLNSVDSQKLSPYLPNPKDHLNQRVYTIEIHNTQLGFFSENGSQYMGPQDFPGLENHLKPLTESIKLSLTQNQKEASLHLQNQIQALPLQATSTFSIQSTDPNPKLLTHQKNEMPKPEVEAESEADSFLFVQKTTEAVLKSNTIRNHLNALQKKVSFTEFTYEPSTDDSYMLANIKVHYYRPDSVGPFTANSTHRPDGFFLARIDKATLSLQQVLPLPTEYSFDPISLMGGGAHVISDKDGKIFTMKNPHENLKCSALFF